MKQKLLILLSIFSSLLSSSNIYQHESKKIIIHLKGYLPYEQIISSDGKICYKDILDQLVFFEQSNIHIYHLDYCFYSSQNISFKALEKYQISLNRASKEELMLLEGIGEKTALKIIEYRNQLPFLFLEELMEVKGIKTKKYNRIKDYLVI